MRLSLEQVEPRSTFCKDLYSILSAHRITHQMQRAQWDHIVAVVSADNISSMEKLLFGRRTVDSRWSALVPSARDVVLISLPLW
jgi:hypothetical protein